jgi:predicted Rossmann fold nucleotide-binding protein DprA/Smf involved in DNA uptake
MDVTELILLLSDVSGVGEKTLAAVLQRNAVLRRAPEQFLALDADRLVDEYGFRREAAQHVQSLTSASSDKAIAAAREMRRPGIQLLTIMDAAYPKRLFESLDHPPPVLYTYGTLDLADAPLFAVANSNGAGEDALAACDRAAEAAIARGWWPVTGHNRVPYQRPALVSRRNGGRVCYVLDRGMFEAFGGDLRRELFPAARIWSPAYDPICDLTLSPFPLRAHSLAAHNQRRDEIVFSMARVVLVGEVRAGGNMERECRRALSGGCPVFLLGPQRDSDAAWLDHGARRIATDELIDSLPAAI